MAEVAVVHLVRRGNPPSGLERFLASYRAHPAGVPHELVILLKGYTNDAQIADVTPKLADVAHRTLRVPDPGFDITAYFRAAHACAYPMLLFLNSFSEVLADNWLKLFYEAVRQPGVGVAGATGSWQSIYSDYAYRQAQSRHSLVEHAKGVARIFWHWRSREDFPEFPNPHLRTNGFMIRSDLMRSLELKLIRTKRDAYRFESGYRSLTRQVLARGRQCVIVGRDGITYPPETWDRSRTFWNGSQENLVIADNQTRNFEHGDAALRRRLSFHAWRNPPTYDWSESTARKAK